MFVTALAQHALLGVPLGAAQLGSVALASIALALYNGALRCGCFGDVCARSAERTGCCGMCAGESRDT